MVILNLSDLKRIETIAKKLMKLGVGEERAVDFAMHVDVYNVYRCVRDLKHILPNGTSTYTQEPCVNPLCNCEYGGFIETITENGRMMTQVVCGDALWDKSKFERI